MVSRLILRTLKEDAAIYCSDTSQIRATEDAYPAAPGEPIAPIHPFPVGELAEMGTV